MAEAFARPAITFALAISSVKSILVVISEQSDPRQPNCAARPMNLEEKWDFRHNMC